MYPIIIIPENYKEFIKLDAFKNNHVFETKDTNFNFNNEQKKEKNIDFRNTIITLIVIIIFFYISPIITIFLAIAILFSLRKYNYFYKSNITNYDSESIFKTKPYEFVMIKDFKIVDKVATEYGNSIYTFGRSGLSKKGVTEKYFYKYLKSFFGILVSDSFDMQMRFYPDFILIDELNKIKIAIEIDEPYNFENRMPIHIKNSHNYKHSIYNNSGWFIIRFAEEQIVKYPEKCCEEISYLRNKIINKTNSSDLLVTKYFSIQVKEWAETEARYFEMNKFREKYLREKNINY